MKKIFLTISILIIMSVMSCGDLPETFKVIYHSNGSDYGNPPTDDNKYKTGERATVLGRYTLEKTGYKFDGWNTSQDYSGDHYNEGDKIEIKNINIFLFPVWEED